jgi:four helix bundle protein
MAESIICERAFEFTVRILKLCKPLWQRGPVARHIASQLIKSATSIGSNAEEAEEGQTKPDFIAKLSIAQKESRETRYWLRLASRMQIVKHDEITWEMDEINQLRSMIISAIKTAQASSSRGQQEQDAQPSSAQS